MMWSAVLAIDDPGSILLLTVMMFGFAFGIGRVVRNRSDRIEARLKIIEEKLDKLAK